MWAGALGSTVSSFYFFPPFFPWFLCYPGIAPCLGTGSRGVGLRASSDSGQLPGIEPWASPPRCPEKPRGFSRQGVCQGRCLEQCTGGAVLVVTAASLSDKFCRISLQERPTIERGAHLPRELLRKSEEFTWLIRNIWILLISHLETKTERRTLLQRSLLSNNAFFLPKVTLDNKQ